jgi:hypothetical protein
VCTLSDSGTNLLTQSFAAVRQHLSPFLMQLASRGRRLACAGPHFPLRCRDRVFMTKKVNDPDFWRSRGEEVLTMADNMREPGSRAVLLRIANDYERIARFVEERLRRTAVVGVEK